MYGLVCEVICEWKKDYFDKLIVVYVVLFDVVFVINNECDFVSYLGL